MDEINILYEDYKKTRKEIYLKSLYAMCISKIENKVLNIMKIYTELLKNNKFLLEKLEDDAYKKIISSRILIKLNEKNLTKNESLNEFDYALFKIYIGINENNFEEVQGILDRFNDELTPLISCNSTERLPQDVKKINALIFEMVRKELFIEYRIEEKHSEIIEGMELTITSSQVIDSLKTFSEIYNRRQKSVHLDFVDSIDSLKLKNQIAATELVFKQLDQFEQGMDNERRTYNEQ